jgi:hypothetical protein
MNYDIWLEGFEFSIDESATASFIETVEAESFQEACDKCKLSNDSLYNSKNLTYWGCKLYDNENDARKNFGHHQRLTI